MDGVDRLLAGRYRVVSRLGRGGMGVVWRAVDEVLGREVAVKELRTFTDAHGPELADLRLRMQREARAAARVRHTGVVVVHDIAEVDGRPLIVMELIDGPSLDDVLGERGPIDPREAAGIGAKVMEALAAAHSVGVLHRDVKPGNILLDRTGRVVLTDFGIATMDDPGDGSATHLTRSGELIGSLDYLAPERAQGADPGPASDVWALGATLYAAVEGTAPFRRTSTYSTLTAIVSEPFPEPHRAGRLGPVLRQLMDKRPELRPGADRARELLEAVAGSARSDAPTTMLRATGGGTPAPAPRFGAVEPKGSAGAGTSETEGVTGAALAGAGAGAGAEEAGVAGPAETGRGIGSAGAVTAAGLGGAEGVASAGQSVEGAGGVAPAGQGFGAVELVGDGDGGVEPASGGTPESAGPGNAVAATAGRSGSEQSIPGSPGRLEAAAYGSGAAGASGRGEQDLGSPGRLEAAVQGSGEAGAPGSGERGFGSSGQLEAAAYGSGAAGAPGPGPQNLGSPGPLEATAHGSGAASAPGPGEQGPDPSERLASDALPSAPTSASTPPPTSTSTPLPSSVPQGFGPPLTPVAHPTGPMTTRPPAAPRRNARILIAAAVVAVVLAGAGVFVARMVNSGDSKATSQPSLSAPAGDVVGPASPTGPTDGHRSADAKPTGQGDDGAQAPTQQDTGKGESTTEGQAPGAAPTKSEVGGGSAPTTGGATPSSSSSATPACQSIGGGKYNCQVWRSAKSYTASGTEVGVLGAGTNYFFCQQNVGRRETYGQWTNVWWAKTDDDSGNTDVYVSDVYIKGGGNDEPVPGLPVC
nr:serine/threonine-protein kinase [Streptomyces sp. NBC_01478]